MTFLNPRVTFVTVSADFDHAVLTGLFQPVKKIKAAFGWGHLPTNEDLANDLREIHWMKWTGEL